MSFLQAGVSVLADINFAGKLVEREYDPFRQVAEMGTQTATSQVKIDAKSGHHGFSINYPSLDGQQVPHDAARVLRVAAGLLGLDVHEKPNSWAEVWLTFKDSAGDAGLSGTQLHSATAKVREGEAYQVKERRWHELVLTKLQALVVQSKVAPTTQEQHDWGPNFGEHLELAEFILSRITQHVSILGDPEKEDRPLVLRDYTDAMVKKVCADLRQWMEQLASLISLYHVHLLDLERERVVLARKLDKEVERNNESEHRCKDAETRYVALKQHWEEDKLKRRAEQLLGITAQPDDDTLAYSQRDLDRLRKEWEREFLTPLNEEIKDLRMKLGNLQDKVKDGAGKLRDMRRLGAQKSRHGDLGGGEDESEGLSQKGIAILTAALNALAERTSEDPISEALLRIADACKQDEGKLQQVLLDINKIPQASKPDASAAAGVDKDGDRDGLGGRDGLGPNQGVGKASECLEVVAVQMDNLEKRLRACPPKAGVKTLGLLAAWARDTVKTAQAQVKEHMEGSGPAKKPLRWQQPPDWDLGLLSKDTGRAVGCQANLGRDDDDDFGGKRSHRRTVRGEDLGPAGLSAELANLQAEAAEKLAIEQDRANEEISRLEKDLAAANAKVRELTRRILDMERIMKAKGLGQELGEAMLESGLAEYLASARNVFERLYRDAIDRMRRFAEMQSRRHEENQLEFLRQVEAIFSMPENGVFADVGLIAPNSSPREQKSARRGSPKVEVAASMVHDAPTGTACRNPVETRITDANPVNLSDPLHIVSLHTDRSPRSPDKPAEAPPPPGKLFLRTVPQPPLQSRAHGTDQQGDSVPELYITSATAGANSMSPIKTQRRGRTTGSTQSALPPIDHRQHPNQNLESLSPYGLAIGSVSASPKTRRTQSTSPPPRPLHAPHRAVSASPAFDANSPEFPLSIERLIAPGTLGPSSTELTSPSAQNKRVSPLKSNGFGKAAVGPRLLQQRGAASMPQLGRPPPRLLMQDVVPPHR